MISQTPQVWMDFQSYEDETGLMLTWDTVDELFPENMIDDMMESFGKLLRTLITEEWNQKFDVLPEKRKKSIEEQTDIGELTEPGCIHETFMEWSKKTPDAVALVDTGKNISITYKELRDRVQSVAAAIIQYEIKDEPIAITLPRGYKQIEAALAILVSGNCYVPVSADQPEERRKLIHEKMGIKYVITSGQIRENIQWNEKIGVFCLEDMEKEAVLDEYEYPVVSPDSTAYVIMTSGTTGLPKGVEIAHKSAWNTICDINKRYAVNEKDVALAISAMDFDLSVYDVFGILGAGAKLVLLPDSEKRNAEYWHEQILKYGVTIWNSVPALLEMLLVVVEMKKEKLPFRVAMLSGDWIGLELPNKLSGLTNNCTFAAMGGATEASIWSNYQLVTLPLPKEWKTIPYGNPLKGQAYRVVDSTGKDCPNWVQGELWIGGYGVAKGYRENPKLTKEKFVVDKKGRWYRTGDNGRFWDNGTIEFLGRNDRQVKIKGNRIELGEIESALAGLPSVLSVIVCIIGNTRKQIAAYVVLKKNFDENEYEIMDELKHILPDYMLPDILHLSDSVPLGFNGKIDINKITDSLNKGNKVNDYEPPENELENKIKKIWENILQKDKISRNDNFFKLGGDSLKAVVIVTTIKQEMIEFADISVRLLYEFPTIAQFANAINAKIDKFEIETI